MNFVDKEGNSFTVNDMQLPRSFQNWNSIEVYGYPDNLQLEKIWIASVFHKDFQSKNYDFKGQKIFDHYPSEPELISVMAQFGGCSWNSHIEVDEGYRVKDVE